MVRWMVGGEGSMGGLVGVCCVEEELMIVWLSGLMDGKSCGCCCFWRFEEKGGERRDEEVWGFVLWKRVSLVLCNNIVSGSGRESARFCVPIS